jgi:DNA-binding NarL/FixJ family response regulator
MKLMLIFKSERYQELLAKQLEQNGYQLIIAPPDQVTELYQQHQPDITITNITLTTTLSGFDVIRHIHQINPQARIIGVSQFYDTSYLTKLQQAKARAYFTQNISPASVLKAINIVSNAGEFWQQRNR